MPSQLIFERRQFPGHVFGGARITLVSLEPRPVPTYQSAQRDFIDSLSLCQCQTIDKMVAGELAKRGYRYARVGGRLYCETEFRVVCDIVNYGLDLGEIAAGIEEMEQEIY